MPSSTSTSPPHRGYRSMAMFRYPAPYAATLGAFLFLLPAASPVLGGDGAMSLAKFPQEVVPIKAWLKANGWESKRHSPKRFEVGGGALKLVSRDDSVMIGTTRGFPVEAAKWPTLRMRIRVAVNPKGTDLTKKSGDDVALRVFVAFGPAQGFLKPPVSLAYAWTENVPAGKIITSPHFGHIKVISIGMGKTGGTGGGWVTIERNLIRDFRAAFPSRHIMPVTGIMLKCDSNNTETTAEAGVKSIELIPAKK